MVTITPIKAPRTLGYDPFGMLLVGRNWDVGGGYRYGFNTQEQDDEVYGNGNLNTAEFWEYDTRLGRRWNLDPITFPNNSQYSVLLCNPIYFVDINGDFVSGPKDKREKRKVNRMVEKACKRDPEFAKIHAARVADQHKTYEYRYNKKNGGSLNTQLATSVPSGQDAETQDINTDVDWVEFGKIDPEYKYYKVKFYEQFNQPLEVQCGTINERENVYTTSISDKDFGEWILASRDYGVEVALDPMPNKTSIRANIWATSGDRYSMNPQGDGYDVVNSCFSTYSAQWRAMSVPIIVKAPKGNFNRQIKKGNFERYTPNGGEKIINNKENLDGSYHIPIYNLESKPNFFIE